MVVISESQGMVSVINWDEIFHRVLAKSKTECYGIPSLDSSGPADRILCLCGRECVSWEDKWEHIFSSVRLFPWKEFPCHGCEHRSFQKEKELQEHKEDCSPFDGLVASPGAAILDCTPYVVQEKYVKECDEGKIALNYHQHWLNARQGSG